MPVPHPYLREYKTVVTLLTRPKGHDAGGKSIIEADTPLTPANPLDPAGNPPTGIIPGFTNVFKTTGFPASNVQGQWNDVHGKMIGLVDQSGVSCRVVDCMVFTPSLL